MKTNTINPLDKPVKLKRLNEKDREMKTKHLDEIGQAPHPGRIARKVRKRRGLTIDDLGVIIGAESSTIELFEKYGDICVWTELPLFQEPEKEKSWGQEVFERYLKALQPTAEEEKSIRRDLNQDVSWLINLLKEMIPENIWEEISNMPPSDPWEKEPKPKKIHSRNNKPAISTLKAINDIQVQENKNSNERKDLKEYSDMKQVTFKVQLVATTDMGEVRKDISILKKKFERIEHIGITLSESKSLLRQIQESVIGYQVNAYLDTLKDCEYCGKTLGCKDHNHIHFRTLFGNISIQSPRFRNCRCRPGNKNTFSPLSLLIQEGVSPELLFMESKWSSLSSYGITTKLLQDFVPVDSNLCAPTVRNHTMGVANRIESELKDEKLCFIEGNPEEWNGLPSPKGPMSIGIDGGYVRSWHKRKKNFEIIVGKSVPESGDIKCFGLVQNIDKKPKRRLFDLLKSQGMQMNQDITFFSDGETVVRELQKYLNPNAKHVLDWFHVTMRLTVLKQYIKGIVSLEKSQNKYDNFSIARQMQAALDATKWKLWHGKVKDALDRFEDVEQLMYNFEEEYPRFKKLEQTVEEFHTYIHRNASMIPNYFKSWRAGRIISTAFIESIVNLLLDKRFSKKQQMQWTPRGAHLLLQIRVKVLNQELSTAFQHWYPDFQFENSTIPLKEVA